MILITSRSLLIALSLSLILTTSPLTMGLWVIIIALSTAWFIRIIFNSWFALITFLIYIGGILVIFRYFLALTPNIALNTRSLIRTFLLSWITILGLFLITPSFTPHHLIPFLNLTSPPLTALYTQTNSIILLFLVATLFLIIVAVVKIINPSLGPLRPFIYV